MIRVREKAGVPSIPTAETIAKKTYSTQQVADILEIHKNTLLNWIRSGKVPDAKRDWKRYRVWTEEDVKSLIEYKNDYSQLELRI